MGSEIASVLPLAFLEGIAALPGSAVTIPLLLAFVTASSVALSLPGTLTPLSFLGGLLLGLGGILVVALGVVVGSHLLFLASRRWLGGWLRRRFADRLDGIGAHLARKGPLYIVGARLGGVPHLVVTAGCAAAPVSARTFLTASLLGMLPAIVLASVAGSGFAAL